MPPSLVDDIRVTHPASLEARELRRKELEQCGQEVMAVLAKYGARLTIAPAQITIVSE